LIGGDVTAFNPSDALPDCAARTDGSMSHGAFV
jgi:hypothetical protein